MVTKCTTNSYVSEITKYVGTQFSVIQRWYSQTTPTSQISHYFQSRLLGQPSHQSVQVQRRWGHTSSDSGPKSGNDSSEGKKFPSKEFKSRFYSFLFGATGGAVTAWEIFKYIYSHTPNPNWPKFIEDTQDALHKPKQKELLDAYNNFNLVKQIHHEFETLNNEIRKIKFLDNTNGLDVIIRNQKEQYQNDIKMLNESHNTKINEIENKLQKEIASLTDNLDSHRKNADGEKDRLYKQLDLYKDCKEDEKCLGDIHKFLTGKTNVKYDKSRDFSQNFGSILQSALQIDLNRDVKTLSFNKNYHVKKNDGFMFIHGLKDNKTIETLDISETDFGQGEPRSEVRALFAMLETNQHLKNLNLYSTYINQSDLESLKACLTKNKTLQTLNLGNTYLKSEQLISLEKDINEGRDESTRITIIK